MPLPIALGMFAIAATGGPGIAKGFSAAVKNAEAEEIYKDAENLKKTADERLMLARNTTAQYMKRLGKTKLKIASREIKHFVNTFQQIKNVQLSECAAIDEWKKLEFTDYELREMQILSSEAQDLINGGLSGLGTAMLVGIGAYKGATAFALASTGTAISSLSGAASMNATLAWFGGGSIAAGGLGVAGGTLILGGLITGPMMLAAGGVMEAKADKNLDIARMNDSWARKYYAETRLAISAMGIIADTAAVIHNQLVSLDRRLAVSIGKMKRILRVNDHWERMNQQEKQEIALCVEYAQAVKQLIDLPLLGDNGLISKQAKNVYDSFQNKMTKEDGQECSQIKDCLTMQKQEEPDMVREALAAVAGAVTGAAAVGGILCAIAQYKKSKKQEDLNNEKIYVDELNMGVMKSWFEDKLTGQGKKGVIFYPTTENLEKWKINIEKSENELIQVVYDEQNNKIIAYREISFSEISAKMSELLSSNGGTIVVDR